MDWLPDSSKAQAFVPGLMILGSCKSRQDSEYSRVSVVGRQFRSFTGSPTRFSTHYAGQHTRFGSVGYKKLAFPPCAALRVTEHTKKGPRPCKSCLEYILVGL